MSPPPVLHVTIRDVAQAAGVHVSTVSRALNPAKRSLISDEVLQVVEAAAQRLGYRPNRAAAALRTGRTHTIGVLVPDITNPVFPPILQGIEAAAAAHEPHRVAFFVHELASAFHSLWNKGKDSPQLRFVNQTDRKSTLARLAFVHAVRSVLASGLAVAGVAAPEEMR